MTPDQIRNEYEKATRAAYSLRGRIKSAEKQEHDGLPLAAEIAERTLPALRRDLEAAEATITELLPRLSEHPALDFAYSTSNFRPRSDFPTAEEIEAMTIPDFLRRTAT